MPDRKQQLKDRPHWLTCSLKGCTNEAFPYAMPWSDGKEGWYCSKVCHDHAAAGLMLTKSDAPQREHGLSRCVSCPRTDTVQGTNMCPDCLKNGWPEGTLKDPEHREIRRKMRDALPREVREGRLSEPEHAKNIGGHCFDWCPACKDARQDGFQACGDTATSPGADPNVAISPHAPNHSPRTAEEDKVELAESDEEGKL